MHPKKEFLLKIPVVAALAYISLVLLSLAYALAKGSDISLAFESALTERVADAVIIAIVYLIAELVKKKTDRKEES